MKNLRKKLLINLLIIFTFILFFRLSYLFFKENRPFGNVARCVETNRKVLALTFDDGPCPNSTEKILDLLKKYKSKATFFVLGMHIEKYPEIFKRIYLEGHEIGNHSWSHARLELRSYSFIYNEFHSTEKKIRELGCKGTIHFRAPRGTGVLILPLILMKMKKNTFYGILS
jgi:chitin deacetylase